MTDEAAVPNPIWEADSTHPQIAADIRDSLREVMDPELGLSVIELGLVRDAHIDDDSQLEITMIMTTPFCPYGPALLEATRKKAETGSGLPTTIEMSMDAWDPSMMEEGAGAAWGFF
jgi:metal-sulfur cluster biosynthetic enzyme